MRGQAKRVRSGATEVGWAGFAGPGPGARALLFPLLFALLACSEADPLVVAHPKLDADDAAIDFGPVTEGTTANKTWRAGNLGPVPLTLSLRLGLGATTEFVLEKTSVTIPGGGFAEIGLAYTPRDVGRDESTLLVTSDDPQRTELSVPIRGGPIAPSVQVSPSPVDFGPATDARVTRAVEIRNVGLATLHLESVLIDSGSSLDFTLRAPPAVLVLAPAGSVEVEIDYQRSSRGEAGSLLVRSDDPEQPEVEARLLPDPFHACEDRADNDGDRLADFPDDPGCTSLRDNDESNPTDCAMGTMMPCGSEVGECELGMRTCTSSTWGPCEGDVRPVAESCDGLDNDCDLRTDEEVSEACKINECGGARACVESSSVAGGQWTECLPVGSSNETCDGLDNDCDGDIDEGIVENCVENGCSGTRICVPGGTGTYTACQVSSSSEICDGIDNDCDGDEDEDIPDISCGVGACVRTALACNLGTPGTCTPGTPGTEVCNNVDDNCDSMPDNLPNLVCGMGACQRSVPACVGGANNTCTPGNPGTEVCNSVDDNCDGQPDNLPALTCGLGTCQRSVAACFNGAPNTCVPGAPITESCNTLDDNCDGTPDNLPNLNCGTGACARSVAACVGGAPNSCVPGMPATEVCNNADDNCDGAPDNLPNLTCGVGACFRSVVACVGGANNSCVAGTPGTEVCNNQDDNCDGTPDNLANITCGVGACFRSVPACAGGANNACTPGVGSPELCNGIDDNCDNNIDEGACTMCGLMSTAADPQEPNNTTNAANPIEPYTANGTFVYEYDLTLLTGDNDWIQFDFPPVGGATNATMTAEITCVSWAGVGCGAGPTVALDAWYYDDFFTGGQRDDQHNGTTGLAVVSSTGGVATLFELNQKFRVRAYPSSSICVGEAANANLRVTIEFN
jgi:hypothetical protein